MKNQKREIRETVPFTIALERIKFLRINLPMDTKDLYSEYYKMLMKETNNTSRWKNITCSWIGRLNCQNDCTVQGSLQIQCNLYQIINGIFLKIRTKIFTTSMETQKTPNSQKAILRKKDGAGGIRLFYFRLHYKATFIKIVFTHTHTRKYKSMEQDRKLRNKTEHLWSISLWQRRQDYTIEERQSSVDDAGKTGQLCVKKKWN